MKKIRTRDGNSPFRVFKSPKGEKYSKKQNNPVFLNGKDKEREERKMKFRMKTFLKKKKNGYEL